MNARGDERLGVMNVHLWRPWSAEHFLNKLPKTCKGIAVMDKTIDEGAQGNPLYLDVSSTLGEHNIPMKIIGGQYGIGSKNFTPGMVEGIIRELKKDNPKKRFNVGIDDDVTHTSID